MIITFGGGYSRPLNCHIWLSPPTTFVSCLIKSCFQNLTVMHEEDYDICAVVYICVATKSENALKVYQLIRKGKCTTGEVFIYLPQSSSC